MSNTIMGMGELLKMKTIPMMTIFMERAIFQEKLKNLKVYFNSKNKAIGKKEKWKKRVKMKEKNVIIKK